MPLYPIIWFSVQINGFQAVMRDPSLSSQCQWLLCFLVIFKFKLFLLFSSKSLVLCLKITTHRIWYFIQDSHCAFVERNDIAQYSNFPPSIINNKTLQPAFVDRFE